LSGFSAAARELGLTQVAVSQQIKSLETKLGHDLFIRHPKKVQLTQAGKAFPPSVREGLDASIALLTWLSPGLTDQTIEGAIGCSKTGGILNRTNVQTKHGC